MCKYHFDVYHPHFDLISQIETGNICVFHSGQIFILCSSDCTWSTFYDHFLSPCDRAAYGQIVQIVLCNYQRQSGSLEPQGMCA